MLKHLLKAPVFPEAYAPFYYTANTEIRTFHALIHKTKITIFSYLRK